MTRHSKLLSLATVFLSAILVGSCISASAQQPPVSSNDPHLQRAADSIRRASDSVRRISDSLQHINDSLRKRADTAGNPLDSLKYPLYDRRGDYLSNPNRNPFDLKPSNLRDSIQYDPVTQQYYIIEKVGNQYYRKPTYLTFDELMQMQAQQDEDEYFRQRADAVDELNRKNLRPKLYVGDNLFNRIFGQGKIDIRPQGNVDIQAGYQGQNIQNPTLPEIARKTGNFDFNESANLNVVGNIGDKLKLPISYNTQANFNFENQLKLDYTGGPDEIIKKIEAGNVSFTTKSTLIAGAQSLFGIKTQLQFGRLSITAVLANQNSQRQTVTAQGGAAVQTFSFSADNYEENRHFLLAQYFRNNFNKNMAQLPLTVSQVQILRMEVWVTNRNGTTTNSRDIVGLMDLGETNPYNPSIHAQTAAPYPFNDANSEYRSIINNPAARGTTTAINELNSLGLQQVQDFEMVYARKLDSSQYYFNPTIGFLSINQTLQPNDVLAVAYQYSYNGQIYQVGEFSEDVPPDTSQGGTSAGAQKVLYLKLLKATSQRTNLPIWNLMMKNVYALQTSTGSILNNIQQAGFQLNVLYNEPSKGEKRYLPEGDKATVPLLTVLNCDRLDARGDPQPDGVFDYLEGYTVLSNYGKIIFPVLEPFGNDLDSLAFKNSQSLAPKYIFHQLYDTIKAVAMTYANVDRYILQGVVKGQAAASSNLSLGAFNVPQGSVTVTAGGQTLKENVDYVVDYNLGTVQIINQAILNSGVPVSLSYENNASFGTQQRSFMGVRLDYLAKNTATKNLTLGGTIERLSERPFFSKLDYGEDPIRNTMYGVDASYKSQAPEVTRFLNRLPNINTKEMSTVSMYGEAALLKPGHPPQIGRGGAGSVYIDDFEGSNSAIDLRFPLTSWALASTPQGNGLFPEGSLIDSLDYGFNRAKLAWYNIEPTLQDPTNSDDPVRYENVVADPRVDPVTTQELFPQQTVQTGQAQLVTFDLAYYPNQKGPYNFDARPGSVTDSGTLLNPQKRWGGIMRALDQTDFETDNIEVIQFWMMNPFLTPADSVGPGGQLYIDLGSVSEDILHDGKKLFENGLNTPNIPAAIDSSSVWGNVPANAVQVTTAFSDNPTDRPYQDVGFDGLDDAGEQRKFANYLSKLAANFGTGSAAYQKALADPSNDDFTNYRDPSYDAAQTGILGRYKNVNNPQGNSPIASAGSTTLTAYTLVPDQEDLNKDNTMNELEQYYEYRVNLVSDSLQANINPFITDVVNFTPSGGTSQTWFQFTIPISQYTQNVGNAPDFRSIQFMRMYLTGFSDSVVLRFAQLQLVRNSWRSFSYKIDTTGQYTLLPTNSSTSFNVTAVNIEQNSSRTPIPYVSPPGVLRQQELSSNNVNLLLNEQAMSLQICGLVKGDVRGVYKTTNLDLRQYGTMDMFVHAEGAGTTDNLSDYDLTAIIRFGSDFVSNYYEIRIPLVKTKWYATLDTDIWPDSNNLNLNLDRLTELKVSRNSATTPDVYYSQTDPDGRSYAILGNPTLGAVSAFFLGVENAQSNTPACTEVWFNELRLYNMKDKSAWAGVGRVDVKLADLGTAYISESYKSVGWGTIDQNITQRSLDANQQIDAAATLELGKFLPKKAAVSVPVYVGVTQTTVTPEFDPFDLDLKLKDKINAAKTNAAKDSIRNQAIDQTTVKTVNFTNVRKNNLSPAKKLKIWSIENFDISYSFTSSQHHSPLAVEDELLTYKGALNYNYMNRGKYWEPFKKAIKSKSPWLALVKDFNVKFLPSTLSFHTDLNRQFGAYRSRNIGGPPDILPETYNKFFTFNRVYTLHWDLTRSLNINFNATNNAWVDEDSGRLNAAGKRNLWTHVLRGGRTIQYNQSASATYNLPTSKFPVVDWTTIKVGYSATFGWTAASQLAITQGNSMMNTQQRLANADLDFTRLYAKWGLLKPLDQPPGSGNNKPPPPKTDSTKKNAKEKKPPPELSGFAKGVARILTSFKHLTINYSDNSASNIYGYLDSTQVLGMNLHSMEPGWAYVFGKRPDTTFINKLGQKGLLSTDPTFNSQNTISYNQKISIVAQFQPVPGFHIDVNFDKTYGQNYSELYKDTGGVGFVRLNPYQTGTFSISFFSLQTLFKKYQSDQVTATFARFENYRGIISNRLGQQNPYSGGLVGADGYAAGYGKYSQDVLIPAFLAAYTNKNPETIPLLNETNGGVTSNPFSGYLPKPNWHISYNGLTKIKGLDKIFTSFTITDAYTSTFSSGSFNRQLNYEDPLRYGQPGFVDTLTGNFVPYYLVPNITISEQFAPLIDLDMQFVNLMQARVGYSTSRQLSLSLVDYQLSESHSTQITLALGYKKKNVPLPFGWKVAGNGGTPSRPPPNPNGAPSGPSPKNASNDLTLRLDFSIRNDAASSSYLDQQTSLPTGGQKVIDIAPSIDYILNSRIDLKFYFEERRTIPNISTTPPITTVKGGLQLRISLVP